MKYVLTWWERPGGSHTDYEMVQKARFRGLSETWHFMLEDVRTRERQVFVNVSEMVAWLTAVLDPTAAEGK